MRKEMTLIENISLHDFGMGNYAFWAKRYFCKPSKRTFAKAQKILKKLDAHWDEMMEKDLGK